MKQFIAISLVALIMGFIACNDNNSKENNTTTRDSTAKTVDSNTNNTTQANNASINDLVSSYLNLKNALTEDKGDDAASAAKQMSASIGGIDGSSLTADQKKIYDDVKDDIKEHAEHIQSNGSDIKHQREHFDLLSKDMIDLVKTTGSNQTLYRDFCPMYNKKKGAFWLSETKEIKNPYYGKEMPKCGEVKEEIKPKG